MVARKQTDIVQIKLRIRESLRKLLEREAKKAGRSLNQELDHRLRASFRLEAEVEEARTEVAEARIAVNRASELINQATQMQRATREMVERLSRLAPEYFQESEEEPDNE